MTALSDCIESADVPERTREQARRELAALRDVVDAALEVDAGHEIDIPAAAGSADRLHDALKSLGAS